MLRRLCTIGAHVSAAAPVSQSSLHATSSQRALPASRPASAPQRVPMSSSSRSDERAMADAALDDGGPTIFDKIIDRSIPARIVFEDRQCLAFHDVNPQAPVHILVIPKQRDGLTQLSKAEARHTQLLGHLLYVAQEIAREQQLSDGFRVVVNDGRDGCQSVFHLHLHLLGGRKLGWPPG